MSTREQIISARDAAIAEAQANAERQLAELDGQGVGKCYRRNDCFWIIIGPIESGSLPFVSFNDIEISTGYLSSGLFKIDKTEIPRADFLAAYRERMSAIHKAATGEELFGVEAASKSTIEKLQKFKDYVHARLDEMGVPKELPESQHTKEGCRVGGRLDWVKERIAVDPLREAAMELARFYNKRYSDVPIEAFSDRSRPFISAYRAALAASTGTADAPQPAPELKWVIHSDAKRLFVDGQHHGTVYLLPANSQAYEWHVSDKSGRSGPSRYSASIEEATKALEATVQPAPEPVKETILVNADGKPSAVGEAVYAPAVDDADEVAAGFVRRSDVCGELIFEHAGRSATISIHADTEIVCRRLRQHVASLLRSERAKAESKVWQRAEEFASAELRLSRNQGERNSIGEVLIRIRNARKGQPQ